MTKPLHPRVLTGDAYTRGFAQSRLHGVDAAAVASTVAQRHSAARAVLETASARRYLAQQRAFAEEHAAPGLAEMRGICEGFRIDEDQVFALFHLSNLSGVYETDGCSAWARPSPAGGAVLAKNRDLSGPHRDGQETFLHVDPNSAGGPFFCVGTLGAPGAYSSGMNAAGLALADTSIQAPRHGIGWLRYFLMTRLLISCRNVDEACTTIAAVRHAGGGSLILADASGDVAVAELLHDGVRISRHAPAYRSNHFWCEDPDTVRSRLSPAALRSTLGRRETLAAMLDAGNVPDEPETIMRAMADHGDERREGLCRHGGDDGSHTVSTVVYRTTDLAILFSRGAPCQSQREAADLRTLTREVRA